MKTDSKIDYDKILSFSVKLAKEAGEIIKKERNKKLILNYKNGNELVTSADIMVDELIRHRISEFYPEHKIYSEENIPENMAEDFFYQPLWIIDPIDGTVNYAHGHYQVAVSIGFACNGELKAGVVYSPFLDELFTAVKGKGAFLNGMPIRCNECGNLRNSLILTGFPYDKSDIEKLVAQVRILLENCQDVRRLGSAALDICWVACGRADAYYETIHLWDFAAAYVVAKEAGARIGNLNVAGNNLPETFNGNDLIVANPELYCKLHDILK